MEAVSNVSPRNFPPQRGKVHPFFLREGGGGGEDGVVYEKR